MFVCFIFFAKLFGSNLIVKDAEGGKIKRKGEKKTKTENTKQEKEIKIRNEKEKKEIGIRKKGPPTANNIYLTLCISRAILSVWSRSGAVEHMGRQTSLRVIQLEIVHLIVCPCALWGEIRQRKREYISI
jgi:hypothetical protein